MSTGYNKFQDEEAADTAPPPQYSQAMVMDTTDPAVGQPGYGPPMGAPSMGQGYDPSMGALSPAMGQGYGPPMGTTTTVAVAPQPQTIMSTTVCQPDDYFGLALFVTICCCLPLGIVGLIKANDVRNRFQVGDIAGAEQASREAKTYSFLGLGFGIGIIVVAIIVTIICVVVALQSV
ncbi:proline-rich transmembrane protein 1-like [Acanthaster planci]|uniref:Proline-rich transmembrane protein 1-like n=1 Tax=Acanthaster planci TaxID=133434 RepID=A0A8B7YSV2_ACAPL|nr:proline-rich transmembrane protein 1-like [Acanthaster planci]